MVKIRTSPNETSGTKKVTIADLNQNIVNLTKTMKEATALLNKSSNMPSSPTSGIKDSKNTSSSSTKTEHSWYYKAGNTAWQNSELKKQSSNIGSTYIGGLTGINPAIIQGLGIDKAIGSILKSTVSGIKKKWAEAGFGGSNNKKVNSAIESNKNVGVTKRLDKIIKLMGSKKTVEQGKTKEEKGFLGKLLSFLGGIVGPLLKIAAWGALLASILSAVQKIADWFGWKPGKDPETDVKNVNVLKDLGKLGKGGYQVAKGKVLNKLNDMSKARRVKQQAEAGALLTKLENEAKRIEKARNLAEEAREAGNVKRASKLDDIADAKEAKFAKDVKYYQKLEERAKSDPLFAKRVAEFRRGKGAVRSGLKIAGGFAIGTGIDAAASELAAWQLDRAGKHVEAESLRRQWKAALPYNAIGTAGGAIAGGVSGAAAGGVGAAPGAVAGANIGYAATDLTISEMVRAKTDYDTHKEFGVPLAKPEHGEISPVRAGADWHYYTLDQLEREGKAAGAKEELKRIWKRNNTPYYEDKEYNGHGLIDRLPDGMVKDWLYRMDHGIGTAFSALPETFGVGTAYLKHWWNNKEDATTSALSDNVISDLTKKQTEENILQLNSDFKSSGLTADVKSPFSLIEKNTSSTNEILKDILDAIEGNGGDIRRGNFTDFLTNGPRGNNSGTIVTPLMPPTLREQ